MKNQTPIEKVTLFTPHNKQKQIIAACTDLEKYFFVTVVAGRRAGKSITGQNLVLWWALKDVGCCIWFVSPTDSQSETIIDAIQKPLKDSPIIKKINNSKGDRSIEFTNGSTVFFKSAMAADSLRGSTVNYMIIDEAAFIPNRLFDTVLMPSMAVGGKKVLLISTPKGRNWFYEYYLRGLDKDNTKFKSFKFTSEDNPFVDPDLIELFRSQVPTAVFEQEYLGIFTDSASVFQNSDLLCTLSPSEPVSGQHYLCGIDIGMLIDDTVVTILNTKGEMVFQDAFTGLEAPELRERILKTLKKYQPLKTLIEENNQGLPLIQDLKRMYKGHIEGFVTSQPSKEEIINKLVAAFSAKEIRCLNNEDLKTQLNAFVFELTPSKKIRYCAANNFHDDRVMSLALAYSMCFDKFRYAPDTNYKCGEDVTGNALIYRNTQTTTQTESGFGLTLSAVTKDNHILVYNITSNLIPPLNTKVRF